MVETQPLQAAWYIVQQSCFNVGVFGSGGQANNYEGHTSPIPTSRYSCGNLQVPSTFADYEYVLDASIDPNIVHQPDITFDKFIAMNNEIIKDYGDMHVNFKKSGSHDEMFSFCKSECSTFSVPMSLAAGRRGNDPPPLFLWFTS